MESQDTEERVQNKEETTEHSNYIYHHKHSYLGGIHNVDEAQSLNKLEDYANNK
jgi:hypothetical protein